MKASYRAIELIKRHEGLRLTAYLCPANVWTIGYGHTLGVRQGDQITQEQAEDLLRQDLAPAEVSLTNLQIQWNQNQFDALVSFVFNVGWGAFRSSTLLKEIRKCVNGEWYYDVDGVHRNSVKEQFKRWKYGGGMILPGLIRRREEEADLYLCQNVFATDR